MKVEIKGFEVWIGAGSVKDKYTLHIPKLKIFNTYEIKKDPISAMETIDKELITEIISNITFQRLN